MAVISARVNPLARDFAERHGGWLLSVCLHLALFGWLAALHVRPVVVKNAPRNLVVQLQPPELRKAPEPRQPELKQPEPKAPPPPPETPPKPAVVAIVPVKIEAAVPAPSVATSASGDAKHAGTPEGDSMTPPSAPDAEPIAKQPPPMPIAELAKKGEAATKQVITPAVGVPKPDIFDPAALPAQLTKPREYTDEEKEVIAQLHKRAETMRQENRSLGMKGSAEIEQKLNALEAEHIAKKSLINSEGVDRGAVREISLSDAPGTVADQIMDRYGIVIKVAHLNGNEKQPGFLNSASTAQGQFVRASGGGDFMVFSFGPRAMAKMSQLEEEALKKGGYDPAKARVVNVTFGPVQSPSGWDLGVKEIKIEAVPQ